MDTSNTKQTSAAIAAPKRRRQLLAIAAVLLGLVLCSAWLASPVMAQIDPPMGQVAPAFDLAISKSAVPEYFTRSSSNRYVINVSRTNANTIAAPVIVEDQMPDGITINSYIAEDWDCTVTGGNFINCLYSKAIPNELLSFPPIIIEVTVTGAAQTEVVNTARLLVTDANAANNRFTLTTLIDPADLEISKTVSPDTVEVNSPLTYTIVITNNGPIDATGIRITDTYSLLLTNVVASPPFTSITNTATSAIGVWSGVSLVSGERRTFTIAARPMSTADGKTINNAVEVKSLNQSDWDLTNNKDSVAFTIGKVEISKSVNKTEAFVGEDVTYQIVVRNGSGANAPNVIATDIFTDVLEILEYSSTQGLITFDSATGKLTNYIGSLAGGNSATITVKARADSSITNSTIISNTASVTWNYPPLKDTSEEVAFLANPAAALEITNSDGVETVIPEQVLTYTIDVKNIGSQVMSPGTIITEYLPPNTTLLNVIKDTLPSDPTIASDYSTISAIITTALDPEEEVSFRVVVKVNKNLPSGTPVINIVKIITPDGIVNGNSANNEVADIDTVNTLSQTGMTINLSVSPTQAKTGDSFTFRIDVKNTGNVSATNIQVNGVMQSVLDYVSNTPPTGTTFSANTSARTYTWTIGSLLPNQARSLVMVWKVNSTVTASNSYNHTATLSWNTNKTLVSNSVKYRVVPSSTLPGTGFAGDGANDAQQDARGLTWLAVGSGALLGLLGIAALGYGLWARRAKPLWANWFVIAGLILLSGGALFGAAAWGLQSTPPPQPQELAVVKRATPVVESYAPPQPKATDFVELLAVWPTPTPDTLPDYPIPAPPEHLNEGPDGNAPDASAMTRILIPNMGLDTVVKYVPYNGSSWLIGGLKQEIAWMGETSWPGLGSNTGLAGHVDLANGDSGPFWNLSDLKAGDQITVFTERNRYVYQMREAKIVPDSDLSVIEPTEKPQLTLITCTGWDAELRLYLQRLVVYADLVAVEALEQTAQGN